MKVLIVNSSCVGGAAIAAINLHKSLISIGVESNFLSLYPNKSLNIPNHYYIYKNEYESPSLSLKSYLKNKLFGYYDYYKDNNHEIQKIKKWLSKNNLNIDHISSPYSKIDITKIPIYSNCDIINLHWVSGLIDYPSFFKNNKKPILWTLHDLNPFSGLFHYYPKNEKIKNWVISIDKKYKAVKKKAYCSENNIQLIALSKWVKEELKNSILRGKNVYLIPNSIDIDVYTPIEKEIAKSNLGISKDKNTILFISDGIENPRKGFQVLLNSLKLIKNDFTLLVVGGSRIDVSTDSIFFGKVYNKKLLSIIYSAADVFILPSIQDNLPNTMLESMACGTPVISFNIGGMKDHIKNNFNGLLVDDINPNSLSYAIEKLLNNKSLYKQNKIREYVEINFSPGKQASDYKEIFLNMMHNE